MAASFLLFGYALIYWRNADMDFMVIYNAFCPQRRQAAGFSSITPRT